MFFMGMMTELRAKGRSAFSRLRASRRSKTVGSTSTAAIRLNSSAELLVWPVAGEIRILLLGQYAIRPATSDQLDDLAIRFHEAARETRREEEANRKSGSAPASTKNNPLGEPGGDQDAA